MSAALTRTPEDTRAKSTPALRNRQLNDLTERYFRGEISAQDFVATYRELSPDYEAAFRHLAERDIAMDSSLVRNSAAAHRYRLRDILMSWLKSVVLIR